APMVINPASLNAPDARDPSPRFERGRVRAFEESLSKPVLLKRKLGNFRPSFPTGTIVRTLPVVDAGSGSPQRAKSFFKQKVAIVALANFEAPAFRRMSRSMAE